MKMNKKPSQDLNAEASALSRLPIGAAIIMALLLFAYLFAFHKLPLDENPDAWGSFGDYMGGLLNPVISLFTLVVAVSVWRLQKKELKETNQAFIKQTTQQTFFSLLQQHRELVNAVELIGDSTQWHKERFMAEKYTGRSTFSAVVSALTDEYANVVAPDIIQQWASDHQFTCADSTSFRPQLMFACWYVGQPCGFADCEGKPFPLALEMSFGHVFRSIFQILKFAAHAPGLTTAEKRDLVNYLRAQMSEDEFVLYALSALTSIGKKSRAVSIVFDFFENRMLTIEWAKPMAALLCPTKENIDFAEQNGFSPLED